MPTNLDHSEVKRYLELLDIQEGEPSLDLLNRIVNAHMTRVPFENISKLYRWKTSGVNDLILLALFLDGIEQYNFGGTCYLNNYYLHQLLRYLRFDVVLCGADMSRPDVHIVNLVRIAGREFLVDVGYAAPFLEPLPRDLSADYVTSLGTDRYVLSPRERTGRSRLTLYRNGIAQHGYVVNPMPRSIGEFAHTIADSFRPDATFMNAVLLVRFRSNGSQVLHNLTFIENEGETTKRRSLSTTDELIDAIQTVFGIPAAISRIALDGISMREDAWS
jgi:N-hydroxyarylamine O-acetyltransferase